MLRNGFGRQLHRLSEASQAAGRRKERRTKVQRFPAVESLEGRALMANLAASATISSAPSGSDFAYTINLTNSSASTGSIHTFWYAWIASPFEDFLATNPISVAPRPDGQIPSLTRGPMMAMRSSLSPIAQAMT